jgi:hypothetical protein
MTIQPAFRLLALGGAKARTNDNTGDLRVEHDQIKYNFE